MLPKERRVPREEFSHILASGVRFNSPKLLLYITKSKNTANNKTRIAFSVSKKVCPKAVDRNRYRRIGYASVSPIIGGLQNGYLLFFSYKKGSVPTTLKVIQNEVSGLLSVSNVLK